MEKYVLAASNDSCHIPYRFWTWEILREEDLSDRMKGPNHNHWHAYCGSWSSVPTEVQQKVERFEKGIGRAIRRPSASGNSTVMIGG